MPVREQLLQLRRRFHSRADEVKAAKAAVERETLADAGAIVERLRSVEALKQVSCSGDDATRPPYLIFSSCVLFLFSCREVGVRVEGRRDVGGGGGTRTVMHCRSCTTVDPRIPITSGRGTPGFANEVDNEGGLLFRVRPCCTFIS